MVKTLYTIVSTISLGVGMVADSPVRQKAVLIAYIGNSSAQTDPTYLQFLKVLRQRSEPAMRTAKLDYFRGRDTDDISIASAIELALAKRATVLVTPTGRSALVARRLARGTPAVFASFIDPVQTGVVDSLRAPHGAMTGVSLADGLNGKRLEILHEACPGVRRVAVLLNKTWARSYGGEARILADGPRLGLSVTALYAETPAEIDTLMTGPAAAAFDAWYVPPTYIAYLAEAKIIAHIARMKKPAIYGTTDEVRGGGAMAYEQDTSFVWETMADLVARVVSGEDPGTIPVERPRRYLLSVRTGPVCGGSHIAPSVIRRADLVFDDLSQPP